MKKGFVILILGLIFAGGCSSSISQILGSQRKEKKASQQTAAEQGKNAAGFMDKMAEQGVLEK